jgi:hypothetical protein
MADLSLLYILLHGKSFIPPTYLIIELGYSIFPDKVQPQSLEIPQFLGKSVFRVKPKYTPKWGIFTKLYKAALHDTNLLFPMTIIPERSPMLHLKGV